MIPGRFFGLYVRFLRVRIDVCKRLAFEVSDKDGPPSLGCQLTARNMLLKRVHKIYIEYAYQ